MESKLKEVALEALEALESIRDLDKKGANPNNPDEGRTLLRDALLTARMSSARVRRKIDELEKNADKYEEDMR